MGFLIPILIIATMSGVLWLARRQRRNRLDQLREQARLKVVEAQMASMRAALRIQAAEYLARRRMQTYADDRDPYINSTAHEEYRPS